MSPKSHSNWPGSFSVSSFFTNHCSHHLTALSSNNKAETFFKQYWGNPLCLNMKGEAPRLWELRSDSFLRLDCLDFMGGMSISFSIIRRMALAPLMSLPNISDQNTISHPIILSSSKTVKKNESWEIFSPIKYVPLFYFLTFRSVCVWFDD